MVMGSLRQETEVAIIGGGPGGYVAALRAADLGKEVLLIEERERLGGTCLLEGCIPSKALIHAVELVESARAAEVMGISFAKPKIDVDALRAWTRSVVQGLTGGIDGLLARRGVEVLHGRAVFDGPHSLRLDDGAGVEFRQAVIATGSSINTLPAGYELPLWTSSTALALPEVPERLLVVGGGYIGLELGRVYAGLGAAVTLVEFFPRLLTGADPDLVKVVLKRSEELFDAILTESKVTGVERSGERYVVTVEHEGQTRREAYDRVLVAVGRRPNSEGLGLEELDIRPDEHGTIPTSPEGRTAREHIFAIGDVAPGPMLAHKASREGKVVAEVIAGQPSAFDNRAVPAVVFTDPELAWTGITETEAKQQGLEVKVGRFPLAALGRSRTLGRPEGLVKVISRPDDGLVLGVGMVGHGVSELIAEGTLALEMGATLEDLMVTIHPHPTMSEAIMEAAEVAAGTAVHVNAPPKKR